MRRPNLPAGSTLAVKTSDGMTARATHATDHGTDPRAPGGDASVDRRADKRVERSPAAHGPRRGEWSANEVLAHLRACADVRGGAALTIVAEARPTFRAIDPRRWIESTDYVDQEFADSLRAFAKQRADLLAVLETLPPDRWARSA